MVSTSDPYPGRDRRARSGGVGRGPSNRSRGGPIDLSAPFLEPNAILADGGEFSDEDLSFVRGLVDKYHGVDRTIETAKDFIHKARTAVSVLPENDYTRSLIMLADYVAERKN